MLEVSSPPTCDEVQLALAEHLVLTSGAQRHVDACQECAFLGFLSRSFTVLPSASLDRTSPLGPGWSLILTQALQTGDPLLGRWQLLRVLGRGGQGEVYQARDLETRDVVALKLVRIRDGDGTSAETANARRVRHSHVCRVYHTERHGKLRVIIMEWVDGPSLAAAPRRPHRDALRIFRAICGGIAAAHEAGVLHLDLKPQNVLLRHGREPVVCDFGLSVYTEAGAAFATGGTPRYMAPEQRRHGAVDHRTDIYALGRLLEHLLAGRRSMFRTAVRAATAEDPAQRPTTVAELLALVDRPLRRRRRLAIAAAALGGLTALGLAAARMVPPPWQPRVEWREDFWSVDHVPRDAWNVALNRKGTGLPAVEVESPMFACGRFPADLIDGEVEYPSWEHGVAFPRAPTVEHPDFSCTELTWLGRCGTFSPDAQLCERLDGDFRVLSETGRDLERFPPERRSRLGQVVPRIRCGERAIAVVLDRDYPIIAVRTWHRDYSHGAPRQFRVELLRPDGTWQAHSVVNSYQARTHKWWEWRGDGSATSAPVTLTFPPTVAHRIRFVMDTCSTLSDAERSEYLRGAPGLEPGNGWLYEIEVFARLSPWQAWWRRLFRD